MANSSIGLKYSLPPMLPRCGADGGLRHTMNFAPAQHANILFMWGGIKQTTAPTAEQRWIRKNEEGAFEKRERKSAMVKQMVFKTGYNANNKKVYICPFCGRSWRNLVNAIACYEQCEQKPLNTLKN